MVAIGALAYFGVFNVKNYTPKKCLFPSEVNCADFQLSKGSPNDLIRLRLTNNMGSSVIIPNAGNISVTTSTGQAFSGCAITGITLPTYSWGDTGAIDLQISCLTNVALTQGSKAKVIVKIGYYDALSNANYTHYLNGELYDTVQ